MRYMRYGYWVDITLGVLLIVSPYVAKFSQDHTALYTNVVAGGLLAIWGIANYVMLGGADADEPHPSHS